MQIPPHEDAHDLRDHGQRWRWLIAVASLIACVAASSARGAMVAPHALFMDHHTRSAVFYVHNSGDLPTEVEVELKFGYPVSDAKGSVRVQLLDAPGPEEPSAADWIRALPRRMVLAPGERQAVRLLARPPAGLADGEYWSRILVTSTEIREAAVIDSTSGVRVGLNLATRTITSLNYRKGSVTTGVELRSFEGSLADGKVAVDLDLARTGNAAYLGRLELVLVDGSGAELQRWDRSIAVYRTLYRHLKLDLDADALEGSRGNYRLAVRLSTERTDIDREDVLPAEVVFRSLALNETP